MLYYSVNFLFLLGTFMLTGLMTVRYSLPILEALIEDKLNLKKFIKNIIDLGF